MQNEIKKRLKSVNINVRVISTTVLIEDTQMSKQILLVEQKHVKPVGYLQSMEELNLGPPNTNPSSRREEGLTDRQTNRQTDRQTDHDRQTDRQTQCVVPENIHTPTTEGIGNSEGWGGQRPRKFRRGGGLNDRFGFQMPFNSIRIHKTFLTY